MALLFDFRISFRESKNFVIFDLVSRFSSLRDFNASSVMLRVAKYIIIFEAIWVPFSEIDELFHRIEGNDMVYNKNILLLH